MGLHGELYMVYTGFFWGLHVGCDWKTSKVTLVPHHDRVVSPIMPGNVD